MRIFLDGVMHDWGWHNPSYPPPRPGRNSGKYTGKVSKSGKVPKARSGGGGKPPKKGGGLCVQVAPQAAIPALLTLGHAIVQSLV